jgi:hypothetical protein
MQKPIIYAEIPEFNQETQAVFQLEPVDMGDNKARRSYHKTE